MSEENNTQNPNHSTTSTTNSSNQSATNTTNGASETTVHLTDFQKLQEQAEKFKNEYLYMRAEFENYKRNAIKERSDLIKYGGERLIRDLLEVADNFERALNVQLNADNLATFKQGIEMTSQELKSLLNRHSVHEIPSEGVPFDPAIHEALSSEPTDKFAPGHVSQVFKKAYKYHDKVLRPGQVVVAKKPE